MWPVKNPSLAAGIAVGITRTSNSGPNNVWVALMF